MFYTVYKITNNINSKIYIGVHKTNDLSDGYMGSGVNIKRAIKKYGIENFIKEYLAIFDNPIDMFEMESKLVDQKFLESNETYNILTGGLGSFDYINNSYWTEEKRILHGKKYGSQAGSWKNKEKRLKVWACVDIEKRKSHAKKMGTLYGGFNKLTEDEISERLQSISDIDLTKLGWVKRVSEKLGLSHSQVKRFMQKYYRGQVYRRN